MVYLKKILAIVEMLRNSASMHRFMKFRCVWSLSFECVIYGWTKFLFFKKFTKQSNYVIPTGRIPYIITKLGETWIYLPGSYLVMQVYFQWQSQRSISDQLRVVIMWLIIPIFSCKVILQANRSTFWWNFNDQHLTQCTLWQRINILPLTVLHYNITLLLLGITYFS